MSLTVRKAAFHDIAVLTQFLADLFSIETDFLIDEARQREGLRLLLENDAAAIVLVAEHEGRPCAMLSGQIVVSTAMGAYSILVEDMYVAPFIRRRGVATKLLEALEEWGRERGASRMQMVADRTNDVALALYKKNNFVTGRMIALYRSFAEYNA